MAAEFSECSHDRRPLILGAKLLLFMAKWVRFAAQGKTQPPEQLKVVHNPIKST